MKKWILLLIALLLPVAALAELTPIEALTVEPEVIVRSVNGVSHLYFYDRADLGQDLRLFLNCTGGVYPYTTTLTWTVIDADGTFAGIAGSESEYAYSTYDFLRGQELAAGQDIVITMDVRDASGLRINTSFLLSDLIEFAQGADGPAIPGEISGPDWGVAGEAMRLSLTWTEGIGPFQVSATYFDDYDGTYHEVLNTTTTDRQITFDVTPAYSGMLTLEVCISGANGTYAYTHGYWPIYRSAGAVPHVTITAPETIVATESCTITWTFSGDGLPYREVWGGIWRDNPTSAPDFEGYEQDETRGYLERFYIEDTDTQFITVTFIVPEWDGEDYDLHVEGNLVNAEWESVPDIEWLQSGKTIHVTQPGGMMGDLDRDDVITLNDVLLIMQGSDSPLADVNLDGAVDMRDAVALLTQLCY